MDGVDGISVTDLLLSPFGVWGPLNGGMRLKCILKKTGT